MACDWGHNDCANLDKKCTLCFTPNQHYDPIVQKRKPVIQKRAQKADGRMGSSFEYKNHVKNDELLTSSKMTPNSGAGKIKGDERIRGLVNIMEELKTKVTRSAPGKESFTIKREWLDKLNREAIAANEEFWYLKFQFHEYDDDTYIIVEEEVVMSMVATLVADRRDAKLAQSKIDVADKMRLLSEAKIIEMQAQIDLLTAQLNQERLERGIDDEQV